MPDLVIIDTDVLIDAGRKIGDATICLEQIGRQASLAISVVSEMELVGCRNKAELRALDKFLSRFQVVKLAVSTFRHSVSLRGVARAHLQIH